MQTEQLIAEIERLNKEAKTIKMDSLTVREKLKELFNLAGLLLPKIKDETFHNILKDNSLIGLLSVNNEEKDNGDLLRHSHDVLDLWQRYSEEAKTNDDEEERRRLLTDLRKQGKI
jgi:hypothetical protein